MLAKTRVFAVIVFCVVVVSLQAGTGSVCCKPPGWSDTLRRVLRFIEKNPDRQNNSPYFNEEFKYADIVMKQGRKIPHVKTKINLVTQETVIESAVGMEGTIEPGIVKEIRYSDTTDRMVTLYTFQTGFPAIDRQTDRHFYQVLAEGKCSFLKSIVKKPVEKKNSFSSDAPAEYETFENLYFFVNGVIRRFRKDEMFVLETLADKEPQVRQFISDKKINIRNQAQVIQLLAYYNSLQ